MGLISNSVIVTGDAFANAMRVEASASFSAALWSFVNWAADDTITIEGTSSSSNVLFGSTQNDSIQGSANSSDLMTGGEGRDTLLGGGGGDNFRYFAGSEIVAGELAHGGLGADALSLFNAGAIDFSFATFISIETLDFVSGNSTATFADNQIGGTGVSAVSGSAGADALVVTAVAQIADLTGLTFDNWTDGTDTITVLGSSSSDTLTGSARNDILEGGASADQLRGGAGDDRYDVDIFDTIVETAGGGTDLVRSTATYVLDNTQEIENLTLTGAAAIDGTGNDIANIITGNGAANILRGLGGRDDIIGGDGNDTIDGGTGNDSLDGGAGFDMANYADRFQSIEVALNSGLAVTLRVGGIAEDSIKNIEGVIGGSAGDNLVGDGRDNVFIGGAGNDTFTGSAGLDTLDGGTGSDTAHFGFKSRIEVTLNGATAATVTVNGVVEDSIRNIENLISGSGDDKLIGDNEANSLAGSTGNDFLKGGGGFDTLNGGGGSDTADYSDKTQKVTVILRGEALATAEVNGAFEDSLSSVENIIGGSAGDKLTGDAEANSFKGRGGKDVINGAAGSDTADYSDKTKTVEVALNGAAKVAVKVNGNKEDTIKNIENITGGSAADKLIGDSKDNAFRGMGGKDTMDGGAGIDTADFSDKAQKVDVTLKGATAVVAKVNGVSHDTIKSIESVIGGNAGDKLVGDDKANSFRGMGGADTINGGSGRDTADFSDKVGSVQLALNGATAVSVKVNGVAEDSIKNIENIIGGQNEDTLTGDSKANNFKGLGGDDTIDGGGGSDTVDFSDHTERVTVALNGATAVRVSGFDDVIRNIENVIGGAGGDI
ncbi:MAG: calcium-binding protein, partial [Devosia sp.]